MSNAEIIATGIAAGVIASLVLFNWAIKLPHPRRIFALLGVFALTGGIPCFYFGDPLFVVFLTGWMFGPLFSALLWLLKNRTYNAKSRSVSLTS